MADSKHTRSYRTLLCDLTNSKAVLLTQNTPDLGGQPVFTLKFRMEDNTVYPRPWGNRITTCCQVVVIITPRPNRLQPEFSEYVTGRTLQLFSLVTDNSLDLSTNTTS